MILPDRLLYKSLAAGPFIIGIISLIAGLYLVKLDLDFKFSEGSWVRVEKETTTQPPPPSSKQVVARFQRLSGVTRLLNVQLAGRIGRQFGTGGAVLPQSALAIASDVPRNVVRAEANALGAQLSYPGKRFSDADAHALRESPRFAANAGLTYLSHHSAVQLGRGGVMASDGLKWEITRLGPQLLAFQAEDYGLMTGAYVHDKPLAPSARAHSGDRYRLIFLAGAAGSQPLFTMVGLAGSFHGAKLLKLQYEAKTLGSKLSLGGAGAINAAFVRLGRVVMAYAEREQRLAAFAGARHLGFNAGANIAMALNPLGAASHIDGLRSIAGNCPERFYKALQWIKNQRISRIKTAVNGISKANAALKGNWLFPLGKVRTVSRCLKYKYYRSGRKKCLRYSRERLRTGAEFISSAERAFVKKAEVFVRSRGRDPLLKSRSPSSWVVNQVSNNLRGYASQPQHPAICTGVPRMVDYFEGNLRKVSKRFGEINGLADKAAPFIKARLHQLNQALLKSSESVSDRLLLHKAYLTAPLNYREPDGNSFGLNSLVLTSLAVRLTERLFGYSAARELAVSEGPFPTFEKIRSLYNARRTQLTADGAEAFSGLMGLLEATAYIYELARKYDDLGLSLFGSLTSLRAAHQAHCTCEIAAIPPSE